MNNKITIRPALPDDGKQIGQLIFDSVRSINIKDYSHEQVEAWAPDPFIFSTYGESFAYVAELGSLIVGFGNITDSGYLHRFYIHKDYQRQGIGSLLLEAIESKSRAHGINEITTEASITAKPFFLANGWIVKEQQTKVLRGQTFINFRMLKKFG
jgi:putative acetyltransferase